METFSMWILQPKPVTINCLVPIQHSLLRNRCLGRRATLVHGGSRNAPSPTSVLWRAQKARLNAARPYSFIYLVVVNKNRRLRLCVLCTIFFIIVVKVQRDSLELVRRWLLIDYTIIFSRVTLLCKMLLFLFSLFLFFFDFTSSFRPIIKYYANLVLVLIRATS